MGGLGGGRSLSDTRFLLVTFVHSLIITPGLWVLDSSLRFLIVRFGVYGVFEFQFGQVSTANQCVLLNESKSSSIYAT